MKSVAKMIGAVVLLFGAIGVGLGLSSWLTLETVQQQYVAGVDGEFARGFGQALLAVIGIQTLSTTFFIGSVASAIAGVYAGPRLPSVPQSVAVGGVGSFLGFFVMLGVTVVIITAVFVDGGATGGQTGGGGSIEFGQLLELSRLLIVGIPPAVVGAISAGLSASPE